MKKNMYSLILAEKVIDEIDRLAASENTNRSNLINQILAEYVSVTTPEKRIAQIFDEMENLFKSAADLPVYHQQHDNTLSIKSALCYRYRPTIRYEVELFRTAENGAFGQLKVNFRTQSPELLTMLTDFFSLWRRLEEIYLPDLYDRAAIYYLDENKLTRTLRYPEGGLYEHTDLGRAITDYVKAFDGMLKKRLSGCSVREIENDVVACLNDGMLII